MKEAINSTVVMLDVVSPTTGEIIKVNGIATEHSKYYSISKITSRINSMNLFDTMSKVCKSSTDIEVFNALTEMHNSSNEIVILNISSLAKQLKVSRAKLNTILKGLETEGFLHKYVSGHYLINAYIFVGRRVKSNTLREKAQKAWDSTNE